jgi:hypothetical protein
MSAIRDKFRSVPVTIPVQMADDTEWWSQIQPSAGFEAAIDAFLPKAESWSDEMLIWGDERGDTAAVCYDSDRKVEWIGFSIDVRDLSLAFVRRICEFAKDQDCMLLTGSNQLIAPDDQTVLAAINHSTAQRYLKDPVSTLLSFRPTEGEVVELAREKTKSEKSGSE